jgi:hypothetical protein
MKLEFSDRYDLQSYLVSDFPEFEARVFARIHACLDKFGFDRRSYFLGKPDAGANGELCLHFDNGLWAVYASERGERLNPAFFASAWHAGRYLLWELLRTHRSMFPDFPNLVADIT